ncbi:NUDIX hydrolase [Arcanobacterium phocae]|uniref:NUDIX hydrolase n=1 Tax=Arcanobacterium phocae TaxID=131112 RepID=UPI001C0EF8AB
MTPFNAAVMALLSGPSNNPSLLVTVRAPKMRTHAGQISLPGGGRDSHETPEETALRETWEEVGIDPQYVDVLGTMQKTVAPRTGHVVVPVIGRLTYDSIESAPYPLKLSVNEVSSAHWITLTDLASPLNRGTWQRAERTGPGFAVGELMIWGFTAQIIDRLLVKTSFNEPWDVTRILEIPQRFGSL